jgi:hypothetical protein
VFTVAGKQQRAIEIDEIARGLCQSGSAGAMPIVRSPTMQPIMIFEFEPPVPLPPPCASASVRPPVLSSLMLTAS